MPRKIIHLDLDAFYCAVEEQLNPELRGQPFAVGGRPDQRGVVTSCSYPARAYGIHSAMPTARALRLYPKLIIVPPHFKEYRAMSREVMEILKGFTPVVEQLSIDEAFLDVSELPEAGEDIASQLQSQIREQLDLPSSLGVATNKLVAKIATDYGKSTKKGGDYPNAIQVVPPGEEASFMAPLPAKALWGVGPKTAQRLAEIGVHNIGDIAAWPPDDLAHRFGSIGRDLSRRARALDDRPVSTSREAKSISQENTFSRDISDDDKLRETIKRQADRVAGSLQKSGLVGKTVKIKLRWPDFTTLTRQTTLSQPTDDAEIIYHTAVRLLEQNRSSGQAVRLLGVGVSKLSAPQPQLSLWDAPDLQREDDLQEVVDELRDRFGEHSIRRGNQIEK